MKDAERLFLAIGGADPELVKRSERKRRRPGWTWGLAAACLVLLLAVGRRLPWHTAELPGSDEESGIHAAGTVRDLEDGSGFFPENGGEIGKLHLLRCEVENTGEGAKTADFLLYVNEERFTVEEAGGVYRVRSGDPLPEDFPLCGLDVLHLSGTTAEAAREAAESGLGESYTETAREEDPPLLPGSLYLRAGEPLETMEPSEYWRAGMAELWFVEDEQGGVFVLVSRYFLEAEEGLGGLFRDMVSSFRVVDLTEPVPGWLRGLYETVGRLIPALLSEDLDAVSGLLAEGAEVRGYGENVWEEASILSVEYVPDGEEAPTGAKVTVTHRLHRTEGEEERRLLLELGYLEGSWYLESARLGPPSA